MVAATPTPINRASDMPETTPPAERSPQQVADLLRRPFAPGVTKQRPVGGGMVDYVPIANVVDRLNRACAQWNWRVSDIRVIDLPITRKGTPTTTPVVHVVGELQIPGLGARQAIGTSPAEGTEDAAKIAESDALKRAANGFGVPSGR